MEITIKAEPKEIADLVHAIQNRQLFVPEDTSNRGMSLDEYKKIHAND